MAVVVDIKGIGRRSLQGSAWLCYYVICGITAFIFGLVQGLATMNHQKIVSIYILQIFEGWFSVIAWVMWFVCILGGYMAIAMPVRPRASKRAALKFWICLVVAHMATHTIWICCICMRCHTFFFNLLAGNIVKEGVETFLEKSSKKQYTQDILYVTTPVLNFISAPFILKFLSQNLPPLNIIFWAGWNWVLVAFLFGIIPLFCIGTAIPVILGYITAIDMGGNGSENVPPSKIAFFYSLDRQDRNDIRTGNLTLAMIEDDLLFGSKSGTGSSNSPRSYAVEEEPKRIPSYKPNRGKVRV